MFFIKKPLPIEAEKVTRDNVEAVEELLSNGTTPWERKYDSEGNFVGYNVHSWEGVDPVYFDAQRNTNDSIYWIIKGLKGECYPCIADEEDDAPLGYLKA